jgi:hypothetical protein
LASLLIEGGMSAWITLTCRDRNRALLLQELIRADATALPLPSAGFDAASTCRR